MLEDIKKELNIKKEAVLKIRVHPGAKKTACREIMSDGTLKIEIKAVPEKGRANEELLDFLADAFDINKKNVKIVSGHKGRSKFIHIRG